MRGQEGTTGRYFRQVSQDRWSRFYLVSDVQIYSISASLGQDEVTPINELDAPINTYARHISGPRSRTGRFGRSSLYSILEEQVRPNQPGPSRSPHPHSGLLRHA